MALALPIALLSLATACSSSPAGGSATPQTAAGGASSAAGGASSAAVAGSVLTGTVSDPFSITFVDSTGAQVTSLKAGSYQVKVTDTSAKHNFHLTGPGVEEKTTVPETKTTTWTVKLSAGTYTFQCDPHAAKGMKGTFTVT